MTKSVASCKETGEQPRARGWRKCVTPNPERAAKPLTCKSTLHLNDHRAIDAVASIALVSTAQSKTSQRNQQLADFFQSVPDSFSGTASVA
jgi:hypothetical protein